MSIIKETDDLEENDSNQGSSTHLQENDSRMGTMSSKHTQDNSESNDTSDMLM
jgi:hypothetical protein